MLKKIVADSSNDLSEKIKKRSKVEIVPLKLYLGDTEFIDTENLDVIDFINQMINFDGVPRSSCPSPQDFLDSYKGAEDVFVVTLTEKLSGTYNSAMLAKKIYHEEIGEKFIYVFNSKSAAVGQTLISLKIRDLINEGYESSEIVTKVENYISEMKTIFVSESLDNFIKNGRISKIAGIVANTFKIFPIMESTDEGDIVLKDKARKAKAYKILVNAIVEKNKKINMEDKILGITHVNNLKRAEKIKKEIESKCNFKEIIIVQASGVSSLYCDNRGIIVAF